jgi:transcription initiation factor TFIID TATA-box-binding protein
MSDNGIRELNQYQITNVVGWVDFERELALDAVEETFEHRAEIASVAYDPSTAHWLQSRFEPDDTYVAFYRKGKCTIAGCESVEHSAEVADRVVALMRDLLQFSGDPPRGINNIVATFDFGQEVSPEALILNLGFDNIEYEPEIFPAIVYRGDYFVCLIFASGKCVVTGVASEKRVSDAVEEVTKLLADGIDD